MKPYYEDDAVTIYHGKWEDVLPTLDDGSAQLAVTSPPYNLKRQWWDQGSNGIHGALAAKHAEQWYDDTLPEDEYQVQQRAVVTELLRVCTSVAYNHKVRYAFKREGRAFHPMEWLAGFPLWVEIVWDKGGGPALNCSRPVVSDERVFVLGKPAAWHTHHRTTVWRIASPTNAAHPCPMAPQVAQLLIGQFSDPGALIVDPYMGSGTTVAAARALSRKAIGIEVREDYCEIAARALDQGVLDFGAAS